MCAVTILVITAHDITDVNQCYVLSAKSAGVLEIAHRQKMQSNT